MARRSVQGALSQVHSSADQATFLLRQRTTPQLRSLSDFQGPTSAPSSSTKIRVSAKVRVRIRGVRRERSRRCIPQPIRLIFCSANAPHHS